MTETTKPFTTPEDPQPGHERAAVLDALKAAALLCSDESDLTDPDAARVLRHLEGNGWHLVHPPEGGGVTTFGPDQTVHVLDPGEARVLLPEDGDHEINIISACVAVIDDHPDPVTRSRIAAYLDERYNPPKGSDWALSPRIETSWMPPKDGG